MRCGRIKGGSLRNKVGGANHGRVPAIRGQESLLTLSVTSPSRVKCSGIQLTIATDEEAIAVCKIFAYLKVNSDVNMCALADLQLS